MPPKKKTVTSPQHVNLDSYYVRNLHQIYPDKKMTKSAREMLTTVVNRFLQRFCYFIVTCMEHNRSKTISSRDVQSATRLILVGLVAKHAVSEGTKAVTKFVSYLPNKKKKRVTTAAKAGLQLPPSRIRHFFEVCVRDYVIDSRISKNAPVYATAVLEYLLCEFIELAGKDKDKITGTDIQTAIDQDDELSRSLCHVSKTDI
jgi:histone H2B